MNLTKGFLLIVFCGLLTCTGAYAQDSLILYSGKHYKGKIVDYNKNSTVLSMQFQKRNKLKTKVLRAEDVFALYYKDSVGKILYAPLITEEQPVSLEQMRSYITGENLAQYRYHAPWASAVGAVSGVGILFMGIWGVAVPAAYVGTVAAMPTLPKNKKYFPPEKLNDEYYVDGFKQVARRKKITNAAIGSAASVLVCGTIAAILTFKYYNN